VDLDKEIVQTERIIKAYEGVPKTEANQECLVSAIALLAFLHNLVVLKATVVKNQEKLMASCERARLEWHGDQDHWHRYQ
jgi:hypothetical protein